MNFGDCPECKKYKFLRDDTGICPTCESEGKADLDDLLERASTTPQDTVDRVRDSST